MATGRTTYNHMRFYADGYDLSGYSRQVGPLVWEYEEADLTAGLGDAARGRLPANCMINIGGYNGNLDNTASGLHAVAVSPGVSRVVMAPWGIRAAPAAGDPVFCGRFQQAGYQAQEDGGAMTVTIPWDGWDAANLIAFDKPWGVLLHANSAATAANTGTGVDDYGAATALGGYLVYQIFSMNAAGTVTISVDDSADNSSFAALSGASSGAIGYASTPTAGIVAIGTGATVRQYLRWQIALAGGATTCTFASAFIRETRS